jgi:3-phosphoshikimate 1-carboxyvinyltransferase
MKLLARPSGPIQGRARPPGDKSISHRALLLGALAEGTTAIEGLLEGADVLCTANAMRACGAGVTRTGEGRWLVAGKGGLAEPAVPLDFGNSGTGVRLTMGAAAAFPITAVYVGDASLSRRPMARILDPLAAMGARTLARTGGLLPATVRGGDLKPIAYESPHASAQIKSAVLLAALGADGVSSVREPRASRDHTERMLAAFGATVTAATDADGRHVASVTGRPKLVACPVTVPADPSSAAFAAAAALIAPGSDVLLEDVGLNPLRAGFFDTIAEMGADCTVLDRGAAGGEPSGLLRLRHGALRGVSPPPERSAAMIDEFPILAALAAFAEGETVLSGAAELRVKESDRIALMVEGLRACGVDCEERPDGMVIAGRGPGGVKGGAEIRTHGDHRIAMSFLVLGLGATAPVSVDEAEMIATSFPDFAGFMRALGAEIGEA